MVYFLENVPQNDGEKPPLEKEKPAKKASSMNWIFASLSLALLLYRLIVFLEEISYSWYLIHWPMVVLQKMFDYTSREGDWVTVQSVPVT